MRFVDVRVVGDGDEPFFGAVSDFRVASRARSIDAFDSGLETSASAAATSKVDSGDSTTLSHRIGCGVMEPAGRSSRVAVGGRFSALAASLDLRVGLW